MDVDLALFQTNLITHMCRNMCLFLRTCVCKNCAFAYEYAHVLICPKARACVPAHALSCEWATGSVKKGTNEVFRYNGQQVVNHSFHDLLDDLTHSLLGQRGRRRPQKRGSISTRRPAFGSHTARNNFEERLSSCHVAFVQCPLPPTL